MSSEGEKETNDVIDLNFSTTAPFSGIFFCFVCAAAYGNAMQFLSDTMHTLSSKEPLLLLYWDNNIDICLSCTEGTICL